MSRTVRSRKAVTILLSIPVIALGAAGCTSSSQPAASSTVTGHGGGSGGNGNGGPPADGGTYQNSSAVLSALTNAGQSCSPVKAAQNVDLKAPGLLSATSCAPSAASGGASDGSSPVTASVFDNHSDAQTYATVLTSTSGMLIGSAGERIVIGQNWVVFVPDDSAYAARVNSALGGSVLTPPNAG